jgi:16S rRNA (adenine1518-N6/adenine1519-N6)-dimethyltransferase
MSNNKSLGQHWLANRKILSDISAGADISESDVVLEIGPGLGTLTSVLLAKASRVVAVEFDGELARKLPGQFPGKNLEVINQDFLEFDLDKLPKGYKVVANIPYYITNKIIQKLVMAGNKPSVAVLLVQKEVAQRLAASPGDMSVLAISAQVYAEISLGTVVKSELFTPPPKVDSQVVVLKLRNTSLLDNVDERTFFRVVKAGFSAKRKKLRSSLAGGLKISKAEIEAILGSVGISPDIRAQDLSIQEWTHLAEKYSD